VIRVEADVIEVIMLAARPNAFLCICGASRQSANHTWPTVDIRRALAKKNWYELIHSRVCEQQVRRVRHQARRRNYGVLLGNEKSQERLSNFLARHKI
jgi:hypothetical protein